MVEWRRNQQRTPAQEADTDIYIALSNKYGGGKANDHSEDAPRTQPTPPKKKNYYYISHNVNY